MRMISTGKFADKKILLIDKDLKKHNDRTWCFWEKENNFFENIVYKRWDNILVRCEEEIIKNNIEPYHYKQIRGIDFYTHCFSRLQKEKNIEFLHANIEIRGSETFIDDRPLNTEGAVVFNSIYTVPQQKNTIGLLQHFKGWVIEADSPVFDKNCATLMDFSISQQSGCAFMYVLPVTSTKALVEYTLFTKSTLADEAYRNQLKKYISENIGISEYTITEEESGIIPMTNALFEFHKNGMYHIGTAGGQTKASTGYTFRFIQKQADAIVQQLINGKQLSQGQKKFRHHFYDNTFLRVLTEEKITGKEVFLTLFRKNNPEQIFRFLDEESSLSEELKIIGSLPKKEFLSAGIRAFFEML